MISRNEFKLKLINELWRLLSSKGEYDKWICGFIKTIDPRLKPSLKVYYDKKRGRNMWKLVIKFKKIEIDVVHIEPQEDRNDGIKKACLYLVRTGIHSMHNEIEYERERKIEILRESYKNNNRHLPKGRSQRKIPQADWSFINR